MKARASSTAMKIEGKAVNPPAHISIWIVFFCVKITESHILHKTADAIMSCTEHQQMMILMRKKAKYLSLTSKISKWMTWFFFLSFWWSQTYM